MPATESLLERFRAAHTQVLGVSVDSVHCHANWAVSLGGISFPLLADFHPKGAVAQKFGLYLDQAGITDRATVLIDAGGAVRYVKSVTPGGERDIAELAAKCEEIDRAWTGEVFAPAKGEGLAADTTLYVKTRCGFSLRALNARANLHLEDAVRVRNLTEDPAALEHLAKLAGKTTAPCLVTKGMEPMFESEVIVKHLAKAATGL